MPFKKRSSLLPFPVPFPGTPVRPLIFVRIARDSNHHLRAATGAQYYVRFDIYIFYLRRHWRGSTRNAARARERESRTILANIQGVPSGNALGSMSSNTVFFFKRLRRRILYIQFFFVTIFVGFRRPIREYRYRSYNSGSSVEQFDTILWSKK